MKCEQTLKVEIPPNARLKLAVEGLNHNLQHLDMFSLESLASLVQNMRGGDYFISFGAKEKNSPFYERSVDQAVTPTQVVESIYDGAHKILIKRPENYCARFRELLDECLLNIDNYVDFNPEDIVRINSFVFITGPRTITPYHFDPEHNFFFQISGTKKYHVWNPPCLSDLQREKYYARNVLDIGMASLPKSAPGDENIFLLEPGKGLYHPHTSPHWVETGDEVSVSYSFAIETKEMRRNGRAYGFNFYARKFGFSPASVGISGLRDDIKSGLMLFAFPLIENARNGLSLLKGQRGS